MTEREEAFIEQARVMEEILDMKNYFIEESNRTIYKCFGPTGIREVTSDISFEKEMEVKQNNTAYEEKIALCDRLMSFCRTNRLCMANVAATRFLFNHGNFRTVGELEKMKTKERKLAWIFIPAIMIISLIVLFTVKDLWFLLLFIFFEIPILIIWGIGGLYLGNSLFKKIKNSDITRNAQEFDDMNYYCEMALKEGIYLYPKKEEMYRHEPKIVASINQKIEKMFNSE